MRIKEVYNTQKQIALVFLICFSVFFSGYLLTYNVVSSVLGIGFLIASIVSYKRAKATFKNIEW